MAAPPTAGGATITSASIATRGELRAKESTGRDASERVVGRGGAAIAGGSAVLSEAPLATDCHGTNRNGDVAACNGNSTCRSDDQGDCGCAASAASEARALALTAVAGGSPAAGNCSTAGRIGDGDCRRGSIATFPTRAGSRVEHRAAVTSQALGLGIAVSRCSRGVGTGQRGAGATVPTRSDARGNIAAVGGAGSRQRLVEGRETARIGRRVHSH